MKTVYLFIASILLVCTNTNAQTWQWTHPEKNANPPTDAEAHDVEVDASGNVYVLGNFGDSLFLNDIFRTTGYGSYLAKYDSTGKLLWYKTIVPTYDSDYSYDYSIRATDLTVNTSGVYITGKYMPSTGIPDDCSTISHLTSYRIADFNFNSSIADAGLFITKFNSNGKVIWNKTATDPSVCTYPYGGKSHVYSNPFITSDKANNFICAFICQSTVSALQINGDMISLRSGENQAINPCYLVVAKYNGSGSLQWSNYAGGGFNVGSSSGNGFIVDGGSSSIIADKNNNIFVVGSAGDSTYFGAQLFRTSTPPSDGNYAQSTFIAKISSAGIWQFAKELCNNVISSLINPDQLCTDDQNNIYALVNSYPIGGPKPLIILGDTIAYYADYLFSHYLVKIKNNGTLTWHKGFADISSIDFANSICYANNSLYISGNVNLYTSTFGSLTVLRNPVSGGNEYFVAKANTDGDFQWVATAGCIGMASYSIGMEGLTVRAFNDNVYTAGYYTEGINTLGNLNGTYTANGNITRNIFFGKLKDQYIKVGAVTPRQIIPGCTITIPFTSDGLSFSNKNKFTAELSDANGDFTTPTAIGSIKSTGTGTITATIPASLTYGSGYRVRIHSSDTLKTGYNYYAYADTGYVLSLICPSPSAGFTATNITAASATLNWSSVGCASGYKVQYRKKGTTAWTAAPVITTNTPTINLTGLTANTIYQWRVATRCKNNGTFSFSAFSAIKTFTTAAAFASYDLNENNVSAATKTSAIRVYPNPANSNAVIQFTSNKTGKYTVELTDVSGKVLIRKKGQALSGENKIALDISQYAQGMYLINLSDDEHGKRTLKLNKE